MSGRKAMRAAVTALGHGSVVGCGAGGHLPVHGYALRPGGACAQRAAFNADEHSCGADQNDHFGNVAAFKKCMRSRGWVNDAYKPNPPRSRVDRRVNPGDDYISTEDGMSARAWAASESAARRAARCTIKMTRVSIARATA